MFIAVIAFVVSAIPSVALYFWLKGLKSDEEYKENCKNTLKRGMLTVFPVILLSLSFTIIGRLLKIAEINQYLYDAYYKMIVLALAEEIAKFMALKKFLKDKQFSWLDVIVYMVLIGIGFEIAESMVFAIGTDVISMAVRGLTIMHGAFAYVMGRLYGKSLKTGKKVYAVLGFVLPWLMHGIYDFTLTEEIVDVYDWVPIIPVSIAFFSLVLIIQLIFFIR